MIGDPVDVAEQDMSLLQDDIQRIKSKIFLDNTCQHHQGKLGHPVVINQLCSSYFNPRKTKTSKTQLLGKQSFPNIRQGQIKTKTMIAKRKLLKIWGHNKTDTSFSKQDSNIRCIKQQMGYHDERGQPRRGAWTTKELSCHINSEALAVAWKYLLENQQDRGLHTRFKMDNKVAVRSINKSGYSTSSSLLLISRENFNDCPNEVDNAIYRIHPWTTPGQIHYRRPKRHQHSGNNHIRHSAT